MEKTSATRPRDPISLAKARRRLNGNAARTGMDRLRKALCDPARLEIIEALSVGELCVNDLALAIQRTPAATSQHLRVLRDMELVSGTRHGTSVYYHLREGAAKEIDDVLNSLAAVPRASNC